MDARQIVERYHTVDPTTNFVQTSGNYAQALTPDRKKQFLDVYAANGLQFKNTCKQLGLSHHTINHHLEIDPAFREEMVEVQACYAERLEAAQRDYAFDKKCFMDRAMQLRALLPEKYAPRENSSNGNVTIQVQGDLILDAKKRAELIDAEIVGEVESAKKMVKAIGNEVANNNNSDNCG